MTTPVPVRGGAAIAPARRPARRPSRLARPAPGAVGPPRDLVPDWIPGALLAALVVFPVLVERVSTSLTPVVLTALLLCANDLVALVRRDRRALLPIAVVLALVLFSLVLVRLLAQTEGLVWTATVQRLAVVAPLAAAAGYVTTRSGRSRTHLAAVLAATGVSALLACYEWFTDSLLIATADFERNGHVRAVVAAEHPLTLATLFVAMIPVAGWLLPGRRGRALAVLLYVSVWTTDSNGPAAVGLLVLVLTLWPSAARRVATPTTATLFLALFAVYLTIGSFVWSDQIPGTTTSEVSNGYRAALYHLVPQLLAEHPFGFGPRGLPADEYYFYTALGVVDVARTVDSEVVLAVTRFGVLGLLGFAVMCLVPARVVDRLRPQATSLLGIGVVGLFLALHSWTSMTVLWFLLLGCCLTALRTAGSGPQTAPAGVPCPRRVK